MCCELSSQRGEKSSARAIMSADAFVAFAYGDLKQYGFFSLFWIACKLSLLTIAS